MNALRNMLILALATFIGAASSISFASAREIEVFTVTEIIPAGSIYSRSLTNGDERETVLATVISASPVILRTLSDEGNRLRSRGGDFRDQVYYQGQSSTGRQLSTVESLGTGVWWFHVDNTGSHPVEVTLRVVALVDESGNPLDPALFDPTPADPARLVATSAQVSGEYAGSRGVELEPIEPVPAPPPGRSGTFIPDPDVRVTDEPRPARAALASSESLTNPELPLPEFPQLVPDLAPSEIPVLNGEGLLYRYFSVVPSGHDLALTFDDGPHPINTPRLLDILARYHIKATFFVLGSRAQEHPEILRRILAEGHEIGNHSWSHPDLRALERSSGAAAVKSEISRTSAVIQEATGQLPHLFRPPYGSFSDQQCQTTLEETGMPSILWNVDPNDWQLPGSSVVTERLVNAARPGSILLSHDIHEGTIDAIPATIERLQASGYRFLTVSQLIATEQEPQQAGEVIAGTVPAEQAEAESASGETAAMVSGETLPAKPAPAGNS